MIKIALTITISQRSNRWMVVVDSIIFTSSHIDSPTLLVNHGYPLHFIKVNHSPTIVGKSLWVEPYEGKLDNTKNGPGMGGFLLLHRILG